MSKITEPMLLDKTGQQFLGLMEKQNELLTAIASGYNYKPTSIADVFAVVQSGNASQVFNYGDQIILPWTDKAPGKTYECPLDVVHFGDVTLADGSHRKDGYTGRTIRAAGTHIKEWSREKSYCY